MRYRNTKTGMESDQFSEADWKTGVPQKKGWVKNDERPVKTMPKDLVDFVFKKKPTWDLVSADKPIVPPESEVIKTNPVTGAEAENAAVPTGGPEKIKKQSKPKQNDNPKQKRRTTKRNA